MPFPIPPARRIDGMTIWRNWISENQEKDRLLIAHKRTYDPLFCLKFLRVYYFPMDVIFVGYSFNRTTSCVCEVVFFAQVLNLQNGCQSRTMSQWFGKSIRFYVCPYLRDSTTNDPGETHPVSQDQNQQEHV